MSLPPTARRQSPLRSAVALALLLAAAPAYAEWVILAEVGDTAFYFDPARIEVKGDLRRAWQLRNWKQPDADGRVSAQMLREYDCKDARNRILAVREYAAPMASAKELRRSGFSPGEWEAIAPDTVGALMLARVCSR